MYKLTILGERKINNATVTLNSSAGECSGDIHIRLHKGSEGGADRT
jgi:hypothetical protein